MANNDDRSILQVTMDKDGKPSLQSLNEIIRQLQMNIYKLEGRLGEITLRDSLRVKGAIILEGMDEPSLSADGEIKLFATSTGKLQISEDGAAFVDVIP